MKARLTNKGELSIEYQTKIYQNGRALYDGVRLDIRIGGKTVPLNSLAHATYLRSGDALFIDGVEHEIEGVDNYSNRFKEKRVQTCCMACREAKTVLPGHFACMTTEYDELLVNVNYDGTSWYGVLPSAKSPHNALGQLRAKGLDDDTARHRRDGSGL